MNNIYKTIILNFNSSLSKYPPMNQIIKIITKKSLNMSINFSNKILYVIKPLTMKKTKTSINITLILKGSLLLIIKHIKNQYKLIHTKSNMRELVVMSIFNKINIIKTPTIIINTLSSTIIIKTFRSTTNMSISRTKIIKNNNNNKLIIKLNWIKILENPFRILLNATLLWTK